MKHFDFARVANGLQSALSISLAAALLVGCGTVPLSSSKGPGDMPPIGAQNTMPESSAIAPSSSSTYQVLYSFSDSPDGASPVASVIDVQGMLYGTTPLGGDSRYHNGMFRDYGTVFSIGTTGTEHVLHSFRQLSHGKHPAASLIDVDGTLYGTTTYGGASRRGTVFSVSTSGRERVLYSFHSNGRSDGEYPVASLVNVNGMLYGTTSHGGSRDFGTVFSVTSGGVEKVLYTFRGGSDGELPNASLIDVDGTLYGTTAYGGNKSGCGSDKGCGTVFSVTSSGTEKVLYDFLGGSDGAHPLASLIDVNGTLYGTTVAGGTYGSGTVFSITPSGTEHVLYSFAYSSGSFPYASLIDVGGALYGTASGGGTYSNAGGTVFSITTSGTLKVLHSFGSGSDGNLPKASLIEVHGTLYGTTSAGGSYGHGTVFALTP